MMGKFNPNNHFLSVFLILLLGAPASAIAQAVTRTPVQSLQPLQPLQHLPASPIQGDAIDLNNLPPDVLQCDVCRSRLGLPPLSSNSPDASNSTTKSSSKTRTQSIPTVVANPILTYPTQENKSRDASRSLTDSPVDDRSKNLAPSFAPEFEILRQELHELTAMVQREAKQREQLAVANVRLKRAFEDASRKYAADAQASREEWQAQLTKADDANASVLKLLESKAASEAKLQAQLHEAKATIAQLQSKLRLQEKLAADISAAEAAARRQAMEARAQAEKVLAEKLAAENAPVDQTQGKAVKKKRHEPRPNNKRRKITETWL